MIDNEISIGLSKPKTPTNVAVVLRAAYCFNAKHVYFTDKDGRYNRAARFHTDTQKSEEKVSLSEVDNLADAVHDDYKLVCVELVEGATPLPQFNHPNKAFYVFGPEDGSLSQEIIDRADETVFIPTTGCLNVAMSVNIVLYDRISKYDQNFGDELIKKSRNFNNRLTLR
jgi:tRNA(Leu) C34 or U34 (ribose-2'-O)-methylase TrmL